MSFDPVIDAILNKEKGFVDHPSDRGGPTNWGITQAVARANGYEGDMRLMPESFARQVYLKRYITEPAFDQVHALSEKIGNELIDTGVNMGPPVASMMLQRWLNGFNLRGSRYGDLFVDGRIGRVTLDALGKYIAWRGEQGVRVMCAALNSTQGVRYLEIAEKNPSQEDFLYGWMLHRVLMEA